VEYVDGRSNVYALCGRGLVRKSISVKRRTLYRTTVEICDTKVVMCGPCVRKISRSLAVFDDK